MLDSFFFRYQDASQLLFQAGNSIHNVNPKNLLKLVMPVSTLFHSVPKYVTQSQNTSAEQYAFRARAATETLQTWYNPDTGLWDSTSWWNAANCLTSLLDLALFDANTSVLAKNVSNNTFIQAQQNNIIITKTRGGFTDPIQSDIEFSMSQGIKPKGFINPYYDDEGWWALAWIRAFDLTNETRYLEAAEEIFDDMKLGWPTSCGGGIWWNKDKTSIASISNELFLSVAASLANRVDTIPSSLTISEVLDENNGTTLHNKTYYLDWALREWNWFNKSGVINTQNLVNDEIDIATCQNQGAPVWTYNQGVILGALVELFQALPNSKYIEEAHKIATAAIQNLTREGVLHERCEPFCGADGTQFKGIFMRNLQALQLKEPRTLYETFIETNADSIWVHDRDNSTKQLDLVWSGPLTHAANASTHSSALDALIAAAVVSNRD